MLLSWLVPLSGRSQGQATYSPSSQLGAITSGNGGLRRRQWYEMLQEARGGSRQMV